jgi:hypothetical protein
LWTILVLFERQVYLQGVLNMSLLFLADELRNQRQRASAGGKCIVGIRRVNQPLLLVPAFAPGLTPEPH